jgi:2-keto-4-pentenoate hydratase/2-oxohepta-3-ene-1,7-dioic acid hydratase in catechol pathway
MSCALRWHRSSPTRPRRLDVRFATLSDSSGLVVAAIDADRAIAMDPRVTMRDVVTGAVRAPRRLARSQPLAEVTLGPPVPEPGAIYTIGLNYRAPAEPPGDRPERPLVYGKLPTSVAAHGETLTWDRSLTPNVDAEVELGVVIGSNGGVFGYTIVNDISSRDPWLDGDQWLLGKSMPGFCPVGPWIVTADELETSDLRLGCTINGEPIQDGRTSNMRFSVGEIVSFIGRHVELRPGDLIATGTPARLATPPGPARHLQPGDVVTCWIEGIGELTTRIA